MIYLLVREAKHFDRVKLQEKDETNVLEKLCFFYVSLVLISEFVLFNILPKF